MMLSSKNNCLYLLKCIDIRQFECSFVHHTKIETIYASRFITSLTLRHINMSADHFIRGAGPLDTLDMMMGTVAQMLAA